MLTKLLTKYAKIWNGIKSLIDKTDDKPGKYGKDFIKIKFNSDDNLPLNEIIKLHMLRVIVSLFLKKATNIIPSLFR